MTRLRLLLVAHAVVAHAVVAGGLSLATGWLGSGIVLCVVPALMLGRFVWLDRERTMIGALLLTALLAVVAYSKHGGVAAVTVSLGGFMAAEVAALGARRRRAAPLPHLGGDLLPTLGVAVAAAVATLLMLALTVLRLPMVATIAGLALLVIGLFTVALSKSFNPVSGHETGPGAAPFRS